MAKTTRTFVAIEIPNDRAIKLAKLQTQIGERLAGRAGWILISFMRRLRSSAMSRIRTLTTSAGRSRRRRLRSRRLSSSLRASASFPGRRGRSLWVSLIGPGVETLTALFQAVAKAVTEEGYPPAGRFTPHVTLARIKTKPDEHQDVSPLLREYKGWTAGAFMVNDIVTFSSALTPEGPLHAAMAHGKLLGGKRETSA